MQYFTPTKEQRYVICDIIANGDSALITAGPGTGKSRTAIECAIRRIEKSGMSRPYQVLFLSFSNASVYRLAQSSGLHLSQQQKSLVRFSTYHALAADILRHYGRYIGLPHGVQVIDKLEESLISIERNFPTGGDDAKKCLFALAKEEGLLAFDTLIPLATKLLLTSETLQSAYARRFPLIIVDEFQDTSQSQWDFLKVLGKKSQVIAFSDPNQIIYSSMHQATEQRMSEFLTWKGITVTPFSSHNFRCERADILDFANSLLQGSRITLLEKSNVQMFDASYLSRLRAILALIWKAIHDQIGPGQTIGFLTPSNSIAEETAGNLRNPPSATRVPFPVYVRLARDEAAYDCAILAIAALRDMVLSPSDLTERKAAVAMLAMKRTWEKKVAKSDSIDKTVKFLVQARSSNSNGLFTEFLKSLSACQSIKQAIKPFAESLSAIDGWKRVGNRILAHSGIGVGHANFMDGQQDLFDSIRTARQPKGLEGDEAFEGRTHVLTYHKAKGREFDFVVIVVDPRGESSKQSLDEKRRLYYVAATRAKKWLGVVRYGNEVGEVLGPVLGL